MDRQLPTFGQLERKLSQSIQKLYREELEHSPHKVTCKFFGNNLSIAIEDALTAVEDTLVNENSAQNTVKKLNLAINDAIKLRLKKTVEAVLAIKVEDVLFDCNIETKRAGGIVILSQIPEARNSRSSLKVAPRQNENEEKEDRDKKNLSPQTLD